MARGAPRRARAVSTEARLAATKPLTLATGDGTMIVLPAGLSDGDQIILAHRGIGAVLAVHVTFARKT